MLKKGVSDSSQELDRCLLQMPWYRRKMHPQHQQRKIRLKSTGSRQQRLCTCKELAHAFSWAKMNSSINSTVYPPADFRCFFFTSKSSASRRTVSVGRAWELGTVETLEKLQKDFTALSRHMFKTNSSRKTFTALSRHMFKTLLEGSSLISDSNTWELILVMDTLERWLVCVPFS
jgi:hypothetical protein